MNTTRWTTWGLAVTLTALLSFAETVPQADEPGARLRAAIEKEEVDGDLRAAIEFYRKIVADNGGRRAVAARALLRLGGCYEKLGLEEALKVYRQLVADYADQKDEVAAARSRLAAITKPVSRGGSGMAARVLWTGPPNADTSGEVSPDGRYLTCMIGETGDLGMRDLRTGQTRALTNKGGWDTSGDFAFGSCWSPDGKLIAYGWSIRPYQKKMEPICELRLISSTGEKGSPRVLIRGSEFFIPAGWFPDGKSILALSTVKGREGKILRVSTDDGAVQVLRNIEWPSGPAEVRLSPDGKYVACDTLADPGSVNRNIVLFPVAGGSDRPVATGPFDDRLLGWTPDGRHILFSSNRSGTHDAWLVPVKDGSVSGAPELVKQDFGIVLPIGFGPGGEFYFGREVVMHDVLLADWDLQTGKLVSSPKNVTERFAGATYWPDWSPDGKKVAFIVHRGALYRYAENQVVIRDLGTGKERSLPGVTGAVRSLSWSPDGKSLLLCGRPQSGDSGCWVVDADSGRKQLEVAVVQGEQKPTGGTVWAPDGTAVYYPTWVTNEGRGRIVRHDLKSGSEKILYSLDRFHNPIVLAVSPDGRFLAFMLEALTEGNTAMRPRMMLIPTGGGPARELLRPEEYDIPRVSLAWSPDSRYVYFARRPDNTKATRLCRVPSAGGPVEELQFEADELIELRLRPDGRQIAFTKFSKGHGEIWVMEGFLPE